MYKLNNFSFLSLVLGSAVLCASLSVNAADADGTDGAKKRAVKKPDIAKTGDKRVKSKFVRGSEETTSERNARLKRECKGAVNAGACAGYTR